MMESVKDDFYVEDEPVEDVKRAWESGQPVLVITSGLRQRARHAADRLRGLIDDGRRRAAQIIEPPRQQTKPQRSGQPRSKRAERRPRRARSGHKTLR